jgi:DNA-binding CsgD family transcriptional regulator
LTELSPRQKEIALRLIERKTRAQIAEELGISIHTVGFHLRRARRKLSVQTTADVLIFLACEATRAGSCPLRQLMLI